MKIPCPQCGGEVHLRETAGFPTCPSCGAGLVLDATGVRPHLLYRPRQAPAEVLPLLRRWAVQEGIPAPVILTPPRLTYYPFWRYAQDGPARLVPAWPTLAAYWSALQVPDAEQVFYEPSLIGDASVVEATVPEAAARRRATGNEGAAEGDLVHLPFYKMGVRVGSARVPAHLDACSGRVYTGDLRVVGSDGSSVARRKGHLILGGLIMLAEAVALPSVLALPTVIATGVLVYLALVAGTRGHKA